MRLSRGRSTPAIRAMAQPCRCLCLGLRLQMMRTIPARLTTLQCSQMGLTLDRTFTEYPSKNPGSVELANIAEQSIGTQGVRVAHPTPPPDPLRARSSPGGTRI